jgi:hypothetical protein
MFRRITHVKYFVPLLLILALAGCTIVTGSGNIVSEPREVSNFDEVVLSIAKFHRNMEF